jgi:hypothetical protein
MVDVYSFFESSGAAGRIILFLYDRGRGEVSISVLYDEMRKGYRVRRLMVDSSIDSAVELGLLEQVREGKFVINRLTQKGFEVAEVLNGLRKMLAIKE